MSARMPFFLATSGLEGSPIEGLSSPQPCAFGSSTISRILPDTRIVADFRELGVCQCKRNNYLIVRISRFTLESLRHGRLRIGALRQAVV
jgi:hypothetical protein